MRMAVTHISEAEAARDFAALLARVRAGEEIIIDSDAPAVVLRVAIPAGPGRLLSEIITAAETRGASSPLDGSFTHDLEEAINSHPEPLEPPTWN